MNLILIILLTILPACPTEDSANCSWDASSHGNGLGHSFIDVNGTVYYVS